MRKHASNHGKLIAFDPEETTLDDIVEKAAKKFGMPRTKLNDKTNQPCYLNLYLEGNDLVEDTKELFMNDVLELKYASYNAYSSAQSVASSHNSKVMSIKTIDSEADELSIVEYEDEEELNEELKEDTAAPFAQLPPSSSPNLKPRRKPKAFTAGSRSCAPRVETATPPPTKKAFTGSFSPSIPTPAANVTSFFGSSLGVQAATATKAANITSYFGSSYSVQTAPAEVEMYPAANMKSFFGSSLAVKAAVAKIEKLPAATIEKKDAPAAAAETAPAANIEKQDAPAVNSKAVGSNSSNNSSNNSSSSPTAPAETSEKEDDHEEREQPEEDAHEECEKPAADTKALLGSDDCTPGGQTSPTSNIDKKDDPPTADIEKKDDQEECKKPATKRIRGSSKEEVGNEHHPRIEVALLEPPKKHNHKHKDEGKHQGKGNKKEESTDLDTAPIIPKDIGYKEERKEFVKAADKRKDGYNEESKQHGKAADNQNDAQKDECKQVDKDADNGKDVPKDECKQFVDRITTVLSSMEKRDAAVAAKTKISRNPRPERAASPRRVASPRNLRAPASPRNLKAPASPRNFKGPASPKKEFENLNREIAAAAADAAAAAAAAIATSIELEKLARVRSASPGNERAVSPRNELEKEGREALEFTKKFQANPKQARAEVGIRNDDEPEYTKKLPTQVEVESRNDDDEVDDGDKKPAAKPTKKDIGSIGREKTVAAVAAEIENLDLAGDKETPKEQEEAAAADDSPVLDVTEQKNSKDLPKKKVSFPAQIASFMSETWGCQSVLCPSTILSNE